MLSGRSPSACQNNACDDTLEPTLLDQLEGAFGGRSVAVVSSWDAIAHAVSANPASGMLLSTGRFHSRGIDDALLSAGRTANPWPGNGAYRPDALTGELALRILREAQPRALFVGLGDTDEYAHHGDYARYLQALESADSFLASVESTLAELGDRGARTAVFVTSDHGRNAGFRDHGGAWPESSRVWLVARGPGIVARGAVSAPRSLRLADVAPTARALLGIAPDADPRAGEAIETLLR